ncbi:MAG: hypothetical protein QM638_10435 [Nocardioides sp.]|uniref:hypothetical protein n=1 Tax=Nocardioides sp. TaxID=35761 RepID=UPI0039E3AC78
MTDSYGSTASNFTPASSIVELYRIDAPDTWVAMACEITQFRPTDEDVVRGYIHLTAQLVDGSIVVNSGKHFTAQTAYHIDEALDTQLGTDWSRVVLDFRIDGANRAWVEHGRIPVKDFDFDSDPFFKYFDNEVDELTELGRTTYGKKRGFWRR